MTVIAFLVFENHSAFDLGLHAVFVVTIDTSPDQRLFLFGLAILEIEIRPSIGRLRGGVTRHAILYGLAYGVVMSFMIIWQRRFDAGFDRIELGIDNFARKPERSQFRAFGRA